jgi:hypothetical protein
MMLGILSDQTFEPTMLSGCVLWIRASKGVSKTGDTITAVADQSGVGNNTTASGTPQFVASAINGLPGFNFATTAGDALVGTARLFAQNAERHIFAVVKATAGGAFVWGGSVLTAPKTNPVGDMMVLSTTGADQYFFSDGVTGGNTMTGTWLNTPSVLEVPRGSGATGSLACYQSGALRTGVGSARAEADATGFSVGNRMAAEVRFGGYICEVLAFNRILLAAEAALVRNYFGNLYAITIS